MLRVLKRIPVILLILILLTGCSIETEVLPQLPKKTEPIIDIEEESKEVPIVQDPGEGNESSDWVMVPVGEQRDNDQNGQRSQQNVLLNKEQAIRLFLDAWEHNDLEKMNMLTLQPLEEFFKQSKINFASYTLLDKGDLAGFIRNCLEKLKEFSIDDFDNAKIEDPIPDGDKLNVSVEGYLSLDIMLAYDRNMWKLKSMEANIPGAEETILQDRDTLGQLVLTDIKDMDGNRNYKLLAMGFGGEWEGIGPEPTSTIGIYDCAGKKVNNQQVLRMEDRLESDRVVTEGGMGRVLEGRSTVLVLTEKTAQDNLAIIEGSMVEYYISLYSFDYGKLVKVEEIDWKNVISIELGDRVIPEWIELMGVKTMKENSVESVVVKVGLRDRTDDTEAYQVNEGIFILTKEGGEWVTEWYHVGTFGEYHTVLFEETADGNRPVRLYYIEDMPYGVSEVGGVFEVYHQDGAWNEARVFSERLNVKAVGDMNGDGIAEFLVFDALKLKIYSRDGTTLWETDLPGNTKDMPFTWIGNVGGEQWIVAALHRGDYVNMSSDIYLWEGTDFRLQKAWQSEELGSDGITSMIVRDLDKDGKPEILVNYTDDYLLWGQFFKIFEP